MGDLWNFAADFDEDEEGDYARPYQAARDCLIILLDGSESMHTNTLPSKNSDQEESYFKMSLKAINNLLCQKCIGGEKEYISVVIMNSKNMKNDHNFKHLYTWIPLELPGIECVMDVEKMINSADLKASFDEEFGGNDVSMWDEAFWLAAMSATSKNIRFGTQRVQVFTDCTVPHAGDTQRLDRTKQKIQDLLNQGFSIQMIPPSNMEQFGRRFWNAALDEEVQGIASIEELMRATRQKNVKRRSMGNVGFFLPGGVEFSVGLFNLIAQARVPTAVNLERKTNEEVKTMTTYFNEETTEKLHDRDMQKAQTYGKQRIVLENDEVEGLRRLAPPGMTLLGFKPEKSIKDKHHIRAPLFLQPDETNVRGSTTIFRSLLDRCLANKVVAMCRLVSRRNTPPRMVALMPQAANKQEQIAAGFHVLFMPFADDVRDLKKIKQAPRAKADQDQVEKAKELVVKMSGTYDPTAISNPVLKKHYRAVEDMALQREEETEAKDATLPKAKMEAKAREELDAFSAAVFPPGYVALSGTKRKAGGSGAGAAKKPKPDVDLATEAKAGRLGKLTIPQLKELCADKGIQLKASRKADIIEEIKNKLL